MKIPTKKLSCGFELPEYGMGLWQMGGREVEDRSRDSEEISAIQDAINNGVTHIDVAESYGAGHAERLLGLSIKGYDRQKLIISSKVSAWNQSYDNLLRSFETSIKRIGINYLDLYLLHRFPEPGTSIVDTMRAIDYLVSQGAVKNIGVCNMTVNRFQKAQEYSGHKIVCNQVHYNVQFREAQHKDVVQFCQKNDILLTAWRPLQKGSLPESLLLNKIADKYGKTPTQIALNWLISQDNVVTISKTSNCDHLNENLGAIGWKMDDSDIKIIFEEFPDQKIISDAVPLDYEADTAP